MTEFTGLSDFIADKSDAKNVSISGGETLVGGAIQENVALTVEIVGGDLAGSHDVVLRREAASSVPESRPLNQQFALIEAAFAAGVTVPEPLWYCGNPSVFDGAFYVMRRLTGEALGARVVRDAPHDALVRRLATELARIHTIVPPRDALDFLDPVTESPAIDWIGRYRAYLDAEPDPHPVIEWGLRWLERNAPPKGEIVLCHHDFRTGNYMVEGGELTGVLDWEFAGWSDPMEDVAWFCAKCWRFGSDWEAGGIAARETFYRAYEEASGRAVDRQVIPFWEAMAHVRWAVIALQQTNRHISGREPDLELALIGRRLPELEHEILALTGGS